VTKRATKRTPGGADARSAEMSIRGMPTIHSSASSIPRQASSSTSMPLYGRSRPKNRTTRLSVANGGGPGRLFGEVRERAVRDHVDAPCVDAELVDQARAAVLGVRDDGVEALIERPLCGATAGAALARKHVVRGQHERTPARQEPRVELLDGEPLEVHDVGGARGAAVAQHVGDVLGELERATRALGDGAAAGNVPTGAVERVDAAVVAGGRDGAIGEAAGDELDVGAGGGERGAQRVVVRRRVGRRVDDVDAHGRRR